jgi:hypothetical protein
MPQIKHATIGALVASLVGAAMGFLIWAKELDYSGPNKRIMHLVGWMGLSMVTVAVAVACLSIAFLQYLAAKERDEAGRATERSARRRFARDQA